VAVQQERARESLEDLKARLLAEWREIAERHGVIVRRGPDVLMVYVDSRRVRSNGKWAYVSVVRAEAYYQGFKVIVTIDENGVEDAWVETYATECYCECTSG